MKSLFLVMVMFLSLSLQAKERTLEEALANSEKFMQKAEKFQEDFAKKDVPKRPQRVLKKCKDILSIPDAYLFAQFTCYDMKNRSWNALYCRTAESYRDEAKHVIKELRRSNKKYECNLIYTDDTFDNTKERKVFSFEGFGKITIDYFDKWRVVDLEIKE
jgi:hypothetical protein